MRPLQFLIFGMLLSTGMKGQRGASSIIDTTKYFEFYSNYWINLHHFLYEKADGSQLRSLKEDGNDFLEIGEIAIYNALTGAQVKLLDDAIGYYRDHVTGKDLIRELGRERIWLQDQLIDRSIVDTSISARYTQVLNGASEVYRSTFWPEHLKQNKAVVAQYLSTVKKLEDDVIPRIEKLSLNHWPAKTKVRVDITAYANYAGAYTPTRPRFNIFLSSLDPNTENTGFVETIFHEGSHLLFLYGGPFREGISNLFDKKELDMDYPRNLWHASLFYLCGRTVQDELMNMGINGHLLIMDERRIFSTYNTGVFREALESYYQSQSNFEAAIGSILDHMNDQ